MNSNERPWVVLLAAGKSPRVASTRATDGFEPPRRWRGLDGPSPGARAYARARALAPPDRILAVLDPAETVYWETELAELPAENLIVLPRDRGTAVALLLPFLHVMRRSSNDVVVVLSADDVPADEALFLSAVQRGIDAATAPDNRVVLLGLGPDDHVNEAVRVLLAPGGHANVPRAVEAVTESSPGRLSFAPETELRAGVSLCARPSGMIRLYERSAPWLLRAFLPSLAQRWWWRPWTLAELFDLVPYQEFARGVLRRAPDLLRALSVPPAASWSSLGVPSAARALAS